MSRLRRITEQPIAAQEREETAVMIEEAGPLEPPALPPEPPPTRELWPWLLVLLVLVLAGIAAVYFATRDNQRGSRRATTAAQTVSAPARATAPTATRSTPARVAAPRPSAPARSAVPRLVGLSAPAALKSLRKLGLIGATRGVFSTRPRNEVVAQRPAPSTRLARGATVRLNVSRGPRAVPVPDVVGQSVAAAIDTTKAQGFTPRVVNVPSDQPAGQVIAQHPARASKAAAGSVIRLNVSGGQRRTATTDAGTTTPSPGRPSPAPVAAPVRTSPSPERTSPSPVPAPGRTSPSPERTSPSAPSVSVPDVTGVMLLDARKLLRKAALVTEVRHVPNSLPKETVVAQSPKPDTTARRGAHVLVTVSLGPKPKAASGSQAVGPAASGSQAIGPAASGSQVVVPDVIDADKTTATQQLESDGFAVQVVEQDTTDPAEDGVVIDQAPTADQPAAASSKVTIYVGRYSG